MKQECPKCGGYCTRTSWPAQTHDGIRYRCYSLCTACGYKRRMHREGGAKQILTPTQVEEAARLYEEGIRVREIARRLVMDATTLRRYLREHGVKLNHPGKEPFELITPELYETLRFLRVNLGWYLKDIGEYTGLSTGQAQYYCKQLGFQPPDHKKIDARKSARRTELPNGGEPLAPAMTRDR